MSETRVCPACGTQLPKDAPDAPCSACLMKLGLKSWENRNPIARTIDSPHAGRSNPEFAPPQPHELAALFPQLEVLDLLGCGGMGAVYKARQRSLDRLVALKIIKPDAADDAGFAERFEREAKALARLNHSHIVGVYDFGESAGVYYFVMEYVDGTNLRHLIESKAMRPEEAIQIVPQICEALQFAHDEGVVHRDIKPENILVDSRGRVKIADFGLAKLLSDGGSDHTLTGTHQVMGTPRYMAPEQMEGAHTVDHRADIYSLGVVFYEMLTGELPLGRFDPPSQRATVDEKWDEVVLRSLEKQPSRRYQHASDVKSEVERISDLALPPVRPTSPIRAEEAVADSAPATKPQYGLIMLGGVMAALGLTLLALSLIGGAHVFLWIGMGIALGGGGCCSAAFGKGARLPAGTRMNAGMLIQGAVMIVIGIALYLYSFAAGFGFAPGNPFVWIGMGLIIGGGGCFVGAWNPKELDPRSNESLGRLAGEAPKKPQKQLGLDDALGQAPRVTWLLALAWCACAVATGILNGFAINAANPIAAWALWATWVVVTPTVMCGLFVWVGQRSRGIRYPRYAGEWMWSVHAIAGGLWFLLQGGLFAMQALESLDILEFGLLIPTTSFGLLIVVGLTHAALAVLLVFFVQETRWRVYVATFAFGLLAGAIAHGFTIAGLWSESFRISGAAPTALAVSVLPVILLALAVVGDLITSNRYPWSHWVGVALQACFHAIMLAYVVLQFTHLA